MRSDFSLNSSTLLVSVFSITVLTAIKATRYLNCHTYYAEKRPDQGGDNSNNAAKWKNLTKGQHQYRNIVL